MTAVSKIARDSTLTASKGRWNVGKTVHVPSPIGVTVTTYANGMMKESKVLAQKTANNPIIIRDSLYAARTLRKNIQELQGTDNVTSHLTAVARSPKRQESSGITVVTDQQTIWIFSLSLTFQSNSETNMGED